MRQNWLSPDRGISMSDAQTASNLCNQLATETTVKLSKLNNCTKTVTVDGSEYVTVKGNPIKEDIVALLTAKGDLVALQAFLMENLKAKETLINEAKRSTADLSSIERPTYNSPESPNLLKEVTEEWGWEQLTASELVTYLSAEAKASNIGKFIHNEGTLDKLRKELPTLPDLEWMEVTKGAKTPVKIEVHHTTTDLTKLHVELAALHREAEKVVNSFKAKVKNLVSDKNAEISKVNAELSAAYKEATQKADTDYREKCNVYAAEVRKLNGLHEEEKIQKIKSYAKLRIVIPDSLKGTYDALFK